jgi:peptidoglycan/LPS O-acetylase OafA/YrhL
MWHQGVWFGRFSPLWSISALEQFYLIWPALMLLSSRRALIPLCISGAALAIGWRLVCTYAEMDPIAYTVIPFSGLDQLCIGGLLAICTSDYASQLWSKGFVYATRVSACLFAVLLTGRYFGHEVPWTSYYISLIASLAFAWLSDCARKGIGGLFGKFLNIPLLAHCGKISYAAYLLHNFTELLVPRSPHIRHLLATNYRCLLLIPATFFFADVFWRFFEDPVLRLRESGSLISTLWKNPKAVKASFAAPLIELRRNLVFWGSSVAAAVRGLVVGFAQLPFE